MVTAYALAGRLDGDPIHQGVPLDDGSLFMLAPPVGEELPAKGYDTGESGYAAPTDKPASVPVAVNPKSDRLALLEPFEPVDKLAGYQELPVLLKAQGKCTTDHISPAGPWLKFRGHLDRISDNMFTGANNAFTDSLAPASICSPVRLVRPCRPSPGPTRPRAWAGFRWATRTTARAVRVSMPPCRPRCLGCRVVLVRSFARIHETNLKKQGILPLIFADPGDYERIQKDDRLSFIALDRIAPGKPVAVQLKHADGRIENIEAHHSLTSEQIAWFMAGSAINLIRKQLLGKMA